MGDPGENGGDPWGHGGSRGTWGRLGGPGGTQRGLGDPGEDGGDTHGITGDPGGLGGDTEEDGGDPWGHGGTRGGPRGTWGGGNGRDLGEDGGVSWGHGGPRGTWRRWEGGCPLGDWGHLSDLEGPGGHRGWGDTDPMVTRRDPNPRVVPGGAWGAGGSVGGSPAPGTPRAEVVPGPSGARARRCPPASHRPPPRWEQPRGHGDTGTDHGRGQGGSREGAGTGPG